MIIRNTNQFEYYIIKQLFNDVNVPRCHTENLSYAIIFISFKYTLLLFSRFYFFGCKYKGHEFLRAGAFAPVAPPSATRLIDGLLNMLEQLPLYVTDTKFISKLFLRTFIKYEQHLCFKNVSIMWF